MKISSKKQIEYDLILKSLIGNKITIINSNIKNQIGISGILVYESANLLYLEIDKKVKKILKSNLLIQLEKDSKQIQINCSLLQSTISTRLKKLK